MNANKNPNCKIVWKYDQYLVRIIYAHHNPQYLYFTKAKKPFSSIPLDLQSKILQNHFPRLTLCLNTCKNYQMEEYHVLKSLEMRINI